ncbi:MAG TPA: hypothetical protein PK812_01400 [Beijerinckiaceae bacterium]|nr:hypothetical protein [Beijerinckiaceae bacterium]
MDEPALSPADERFLRYWSVNMTEAFRSSSDAWWPGFAYDAEQKQRMREIAGSEDISGGSVLTFYAIVVLGYIAFAGMASVTIMVPVISWLYPDPSKLPALPFVLLLAGVCLLALGVGLPLSMRAGAWAGDRWAGGRPLPSKPGDAALVARARFQLRRIAIVAAGMLVPGVLLFILFDIDAGPLVFWLKLATVLCVLLSIGALRWLRP